jgi:hypothetical protein
MAQQTLAKNHRLDQPTQTVAVAEAASDMVAEADQGDRVVVPVRNPARQAAQLRKLILAV